MLLSYLTVLLPLRRLNDARRIANGKESPMESRHQRMRTRIKDLAVDDEAALEEEIRRVEKFAANVAGTGKDKSKKNKDKKSMLSRLGRRRGSSPERDAAVEGADTSDAPAVATSPPKRGGNAAIQNFIAGKKAKAKDKAAKK